VITLNEAVTQTYAMRFLILFSRGQSLSKTVTLSICQDVPLVAEYKIGDAGHIRYFLAPKIDDVWKKVEMMKLGMIKERA